MYVNPYIYRLTQVNGTGRIVLSIENTITNKGRYMKKQKNILIGARDCPFI